MHQPNLDIIHKHGEIIYFRAGSLSQQVEGVALNYLELWVCCLFCLKENCLLIFLEGGAKGRQRQNIWMSGKECFFKMCNTIPEVVPDKKSHMFLSCTHFAK